MQLSMIITTDRARDIPEPVMPPGCELRGYRPGDEDAWTELINTGGFGTPWSRERLDEFLNGPERACGSRVATKNGRIVAATFASVEDGVYDMGRVDFVVSHPDVRGTGLGRATCTEVVRYLVGRGYDPVTLYTDDWRLPAIGLYLSMGFDPQMTRRDMPGRWRRIMRALEDSR